MAQKTLDTDTEIIEIIDYQSEKQEELDIIDRKCEDWVKSKLEKGQDEKKGK